MAAVVTNKAFTETALLMTGGVATAWGSIAVGTGSQAENATDLSLVTEVTANGLARAKCATASVTDSAVTGDTCLFVHTFTASSTYAVAECGIFNSLSTGDMLCYGTFATAVPMSSDDTLKITWSVQVKAG